LYQLRTYHEVIDEIYKRVPHVGPWQAGTSRIPSTAYCLLYKCMVMRLTYNQLRGILNTNDSPYVRAIGLLYLRYCCPPKDMWNWYEPLLEDEEEFQPSPDPNLRMTIGEYAIKLLTDMKYYDTTLPRIPVPIERKFKVLLLLLSEKQKRRRGNMRSHEKGLLVAGTKVRAIYSDEENEPAWYDAVIESQENDGNIPKYWVNFPEYGNQSLVDLGEIEIPRERSKSRSKSDRGSSDSRSRRSRSRSRSRDRDRHHRRSRSRSRDRDRDRDVGCSDDLLAKVLQGERNNSTAVGKDYGRRPASYKGSLALKQDRFTARRRSRSRTPPRSDYRRRDRSRSRDRDRKSSKSDSTSNTTTQVSAAQLEKMKKLKEMYGDASASK
jgi:pre-mRNA-splicing factor 38B